MQSPEQIAARHAAAAVLLDVHPDRISICVVTGDVFIDDKPKPYRKKEFSIIAFKVMLMEWLGWADNSGTTADLATHHVTATRPILDRPDLIHAAGLALHLRESSA